MEEKKLKIFTLDKIDFDLNFDEIATKINQILPFSLILVLCTDDDFFEFGNQLCQNLREKGLKLVSLVYNQNLTAQIDDLIAKFSFDCVRGIVVFSKKALSKLVDKKVKVERIFFVQKNADVSGVFFNSYNLGTENLINYYFNKEYFNEIYLRKSFCVKTLYLIDYSFRNQLFNQRIDTLYFSNFKKKLVSAILYLDEFENNAEKLFFLNLELEYLISKSDYTLCSVNVCSQLCSKDFFNLENCFYFSKLVIKKIKDFLSGKMDIENIDYSERAKTICFLLNQNLFETLSELKEQCEKIENPDFSLLKQEIKKLILLYQKFFCKVKDYEEIFCIDENLAKTCLSVAGDTKFSINSLTAFREIIFL